MPNPSRPVVLLIVALAVLSLAGCGWEFPGVQASPSPSTFPASSSPAPVGSPVASATVRPIVTVETRGGECPQGACGSTIVVESTGRVHATSPAAAELGMLSEATVEGLATEIDTADFEALMSRPFTGTCPVAFDGQETVYTFATASGPKRIATCEIEVDPSQPLFVAVTAALSEVAAP